RNALRTSRAPPWLTWWRGVVPVMSGTGRRRSGMAARGIGRGCRNRSRRFPRALAPCLPIPYQDRVRRDVSSPNQHHNHRKDPTMRLPAGFYAVPDPDDESVMARWRVKGGKWSPHPAKTWYGPARPLRKDAPDAPGTDAYIAWMRAHFDQYDAWRRRTLA